MPRPKTSHRLMQEASVAGDIREVFKALALKTSEHMKPEEQGGSGAVPPWTMEMLRSWVAYERGVMQYTEEQPQEDSGAAELAAVLTSIQGGKK